MTQQRPRVGFVGLGDIGGPMAARLIEQGFVTTLWARREASLTPFEGQSFRRAADLAELGRSCDVVGICVFSDDDVRQVILGRAGLLSGMARGGIIVIHATISVDTAVEIAALAAERGVAVLDAPISGGRARALDGTLTIMVGGDKAAFDQVTPVMTAYGQIIELLGPIGSGLKMKLVNNILAYVNLSMAWKAIETARHMGLVEKAAIATLRSSSGASFMLPVLADRYLSDPAFSRHAASMTEKDTRIFQSVCANIGIARSSLDEAAEAAIEIVTELGRRTEPKAICGQGGD